MQDQYVTGITKPTQVIFALGAAGILTAIASVNMRPDFSKFNANNGAEIWLEEGTEVVFSSFVSAINGMAILAISSYLGLTTLPSSILGGVTAAASAYELLDLQQLSGEDAAGNNAA